MWILVVLGFALDGNALSAAQSSVMRKDECLVLFEKNKPTVVALHSALIYYGCVEVPTAIKNPPS